MLNSKNNEEKEDGLNHLTFKEMSVAFQTRPKTKYLWSGVKEKSFGLIFGPSKSGKTIFCENLAMKIAIGAKDFLGYKLDGVPKKVLFVGLEEHWENRIDRNLKQYDSMNKPEQELINSNYLYQRIDFQKKMINESDWQDLEEMIIKSEAEVIFIDSITRLNIGKLENSSDAEFIMQRLRDICYNNGVTLFCIHHTPKMEGYPITMDRIKGSSVFAQESDFAIGINRTGLGYRYAKNVFFRYSEDGDENVKEFLINKNTVVELIDETPEQEILNRSDRRRNDDQRQKIIDFINSDKSKIYKTAELINTFESLLGIKGRQIKEYMSELSKSNKIDGTVHGEYKSINYDKKIEKDNNDDEE